MDDQPVVVEAAISESEGLERIARRREDEPKQVECRFTDAVARIKPAAELLFKTFREMNIPDEISHRPVAFS